MNHSPFGHKSRRGGCYATWCMARKGADLAGKYGFRLDEAADLAQDFRLHLMRNWPAFDPTRSRATTFIHRMVNVRANELIRERRSPKRDHRMERPLSAAAESGRLDGVRGQPEISDQQRFELQDDCTSVLKFLPVELRRIAELLREISPHKATEVLGLPDSTVRRRVAELRGHFVAAGFGDA